jgi:metal-dependent amidase/aminoacylase/carboxypeptidase family protein
MKKINEIYMDLHKIPELGLQEEQTALYIRNILDEVGIEYKTYKTATVAYLDTNRVGQ